MKLKNAKTITAEAMTWEGQEAEKQARARKFLTVWAALATTVAVFETISVAPLMHFQHVVTATVMVNKETGEYRIEQNGSVLNDDDPDWTTQAKDDLARYVKAHEGFTRGEADTIYRTVWLMSSADLRPAWDNYFRPELNDKAPLHTMGSADSWTLSNFSYSFLPTSEPGVHVAQVRYDYVKKVGMLAPTSQRMVSTVTFKYTKTNVPAQTDDLILNARGFEATNYHRDDDGPIKNLTLGAAAEQPDQPAQTAYAQPTGQAPQGGTLQAAVANVLANRRQQQRGAQ